MQSRLPVNVFQHKQWPSAYRYGLSHAGDQVTQTSMKQVSAQSLAVGLCIGGLMCMTNMYYGLQTGWVTMGSLQSAILGYGIFQVLKRQGWVSGFSVAENVIVQTCAVASATMPLAAGFVGVIPAMKHLTVEENPPDGPYTFSTFQLILWSTTLAFFGVFVAVPLRTQVIEREQLRFPSGTATAQIIKTLHQAHGSTDPDTGPLDVTPSVASLLQCPSRVSYNSNIPFGFRLGSSRCSIERPYKRTTADVILSTALSAALEDEASSQARIPSAPATPGTPLHTAIAGSAPVTPEPIPKGEVGGFNVASIETTWSALGYSFALSFVAVCAIAVVEVYNQMQKVHLPTSVPLFGSAAAVYGWKLGANVGYVGQGMIMGPRVSMSMLSGAVIGFGILAPMAVRNGWASESQSSPDGSVAWVSWVAMSVMIADSLTSLAVLLCRYCHGVARARARRRQALPLGGELPVLNTTHSTPDDSVFTAASEPVLQCDTVPEDCPIAQSTPTLQQRQDMSQQRIPTWAWLSGLIGSLVAATAVIGTLFPMPYWQVAVAMCLAMLVAVLAVRALGETDLNPVSGIGKLAQVAFAVLAPGHVVPNLVAGAISEAAAAQAGDMMQDFKTAAILGVCPKCQFGAALLGSMASCWFSTAAYALFAHVYVIGGEKLPAPTAAIWIDMARLVTGGDLPPHVELYCWIGAAVGVVLAIMPDVLDAIRSVSIVAKSASNSLPNRMITAVEWCLPSGIGLAIGAYILPQFVLPRVLGAILAMPSVWSAAAPLRHQGSMLVVASGLVLGEGIASMVSTMVKSVLQ